MDANTSNPPTRQRLSGDSLKFALLGAVFMTIVLVTLTSIARSLMQETPADIHAHTTEQWFNDGNRFLIDFTLTNSHGTAVQRADVAGRWLVVNFVFSGCSLTCMQVNYRMAELQRQLADQSDVLLLSITIDPLSDSPPVLARFASQFKPEQDRWHFLTGDQKMIDLVLSESFLGPRDPSLQKTIPGGWNHVDRIALVAPTGEIHGLFDGLKPTVPREILGAIKAARKEFAKRPL